MYTLYEWWLKISSFALALVFLVIGVVIFIGVNLLWGILAIIAAVCFLLVIIYAAIIEIRT